MTLNSLTASPDTPTSVSLTQTSLLSESPSQIYIYSILNPDTLIEINSNDFTYASPDLSFSYSFRTGEYGIKVWFKGLGWAEISSDITVAAISKNNLCQGSAGHRFALPHLPCSALDSGSELPYTNNTAGSTDVAFIFNKI